MKQIKQDSGFEGQGSIPCVDLGDWTEDKNHLFQNMVMLHIKLKGIVHTITC